jgi:pyrimidine-specific ribonucleoside hydrolase
MTESDIERLGAGDDSAKWLRDVSQPWLSFWNTMAGKPGFHPFDVLAVAYAALPNHFRCEPIPARIGFNLFLEPFGMGRDLEMAKDIHGPIVTTCFDLNPDLKDILLMRLMGQPHSLFRSASAM